MFSIRTVKQFSYLVQPHVPSLDLKLIFSLFFPSIFYFISQCYLCEKIAWISNTRLILYELDITFSQSSNFTKLTLNILNFYLNFFLNFSVTMLLLSAAAAENGLAIVQSCYEIVAALQ